MDVADLIASFSTNPSGSTYPVKRRAGATFLNGRPVDGSVTTIQITASVQPATGADLVRLPELRRTNETRVIFTTTALTIGAPGVNEADLITIDGADWEVQHVESWEQAPGVLAGFYRVIAQRTS